MGAAQRSGWHPARSAEHVAVRVATLLAIFAPFALAYVLSSLLRVVNAVAGPEMSQAFGLSPADLGLMTSVYFIGFALAQFPLGVAMDRFGVRRVNAAVWVIATLGCALFVVGTTLSHLLLGRFLIGFGSSAALMGPMTAFRRVFPPERRALVVSLHMAFGGIGTALGGSPAEATIDALGWRGLFALLTLASLLVIALLVFVLPREDAPAQPVALGRMARDVLAVLGARAFWRVAPLSATIQVGMLSVVSLWSGPWLRQVGGSSSSEAALWLSAIAIGLLAGFLAYGPVFVRAERSGHASLAFALGSALTALAPFALFVVPLEAGPVVWIVYAAVCSVGIHSYNIASSAFPDAMAGRVNTTVNFLVFVAAFLGQWGFGLVLEAFADPEGQPNQTGYLVAFGALAAIQLASALPLLLPGRPRADQPP